MPGHKRRCFGMLPEELCKLDITEIDGFDNLHQPEDILSSLQQEAARLYGAEESFYLVNGSTCGILSAVSCALPGGGHILMARNCHKSAYHAAYLRGLRITYLYPTYREEYDIYDVVEPCQVRCALEREPDIKAVLIVSPTYEGRISDIGAIAEIVHEKGIPLIVDEAHGAHLGLGEGFPKNSCQLGADLVIHSVHKTLPALTQTALLHVNGNRIHRGLLKRFLRIYQSSSPSYLLLMGIDNALQFVGLQGQMLFARFRQRYEAMLKELGVCKHLRFLTDFQGRQDIGKLLISVKGTGITGKQLYDILLQEYHLQLEMASTSYVLAMFTINDEEQAYGRMTEALLSIDRWLETQAGKLGTAGTRGHGTEKLGRAGTDVLDGKWSDAKALDWGQVDGISLGVAWDMLTEVVELGESMGRLMGEFINLYPPGIPILVPGERMTEAVYRRILEAIAQGLTVQGVQVSEGKGLSVPVICEQDQGHDLA